MQRKILFMVFGFLAFIVFCCPVHASRIYYTNQYGVNFTEQQYNFYSEMFFEGYQEFVTVADFNKALSTNIFNGTIEKTSVIIPSYEIGYNKGAIVTEKGRTLSIGKSCDSTECFYSLTAVWNGIPNVTSYDILGSRIVGGSYTYISCGVATGLGYTYTECTPDTPTGGFGYSLQIAPVVNLQVGTSFYTTTGATLYGSYQHAIQNVSLSTSKLYYINYMGYGGVFDFYGAAWGKYDGANGVDA